MSGLREGFDEIVADVRSYGDLDRAIERAGHERRRRLNLVAGIAAAAAVLVAIAGTLVITQGDDARTPQPISPVTPTPNPSATQWPGPVRPGASLPTVPDTQLGPSSNPWRGWADPRDTSVGQIDIRLLAGWGLQLHQAEQLEAWLDAQDRVVEYGLVVDTDGDRVADCQLALSTDAPIRGQYRVLLKNLRTGAEDERVGPPYGFPFEFGFPDGTSSPDAPSLYIEFLGAWQQPCQAPRSRIHWYAYASLTEDGRVTAWDYAPDAAWLRTLPNLAVEFGGRIGTTAWGDDLPLPLQP